MKRSRLAPGKPLARTTPLERTSRLRSSGPIKAKRRDTGPTRKVADAVRDRFDGRCARCGKPGHTKQHRIPRQSGGSRHDPRINKLSNLVWLCGDGTTLCHGEVESHRKKGRADGYLVRRKDDPRLAPMRLWDDRWVLLDDLGGVSETEDPHAVPVREAPVREQGGGEPAPRTRGPHAGRRPCGADEVPVPAVPGMAFDEQATQAPATEVGAAAAVLNGGAA